MELTFKIKPRVIKGFTKEEIRSKTNHGKYMMSNHGSSSVTTDGRQAICINYVKFNKKTQQIKDGRLTISSMIIRNKHWVGYVYYIPIDLLKEMNLVVEQKTRHFVIKKRK